MLCEPLPATDSKESFIYRHHKLTGTSQRRDARHNTCLMPCLTLRQRLILLCCCVTFVSLITSVMVMNAFFQWNLKHKKVSSKLVQLEHSKLWALAKVYLIFFHVKIKQTISRKKLN